MEELNEVIANLTIKQAPGPDAEQTILYRWLLPATRKISLKILNRWWETQVPEDLTQTEVVSIYEKGNPAKPDNCRPISLLNSI